MLVDGHQWFSNEAALVYGQMNEPPGARARVALTGLTVAEYFRDEEGQARRMTFGRGAWDVAMRHSRRLESG